MRNQRVLELLIALFLILGLLVWATSDEIVKHDANNVPTIAGVLNDTGNHIYQVRIDKTTGALLTENTSGGVNTTVNQGNTNASHAQSWWMHISDTTNDLSLLAAPADTQSNATVSIPEIAFNSVFNGTTWDRVREGTATGSVLVNNGTAANLQMTATQTGTWTVQPGNTQNTTAWLTSDAANGSVAAGTIAGKSEDIGCEYLSALPALTTGQQASVQCDSSARLLIGSIASALPTGANSIGTVGLNTGSNVVGGVTESGTWTVQPGNTANTTPWLTTINQGGNSATVTASNALKVDGSGVTQPVSGTVTANAGTGTFTTDTSGTSWTPSHANTGTSWIIKATAGVLHTLTVNTAIASETIKLYNVASASCAGHESTGLIGVVTIPGTITSESPFTLIYDTNFSSGICAEPSSTADLTASFK